MLVLPRQMLSFWVQLRYLLWKTVLTKWRQKFWLAVEVLLPLLLFVLLVLVRLYDFTDSLPACHYDSKALPSAGLLPFVNSLTCSMMNDCRAGPTNGDETEIEANPAGENNLLVDILRFAALQLKVMGKKPMEFTKSLGEMSRTTGVLAGFNYTDLAVPIPLAEALGMNETDLEQLLGSFNMTKGAASSLSKASVRLDLLIKNNITRTVAEAQNCLADNYFELSQCSLIHPALCDSVIFNETVILQDPMNQTDWESLCNVAFSSTTPLHAAKIMQGGRTDRGERLRELAGAVKKLSTSMKWLGKQPITYLMRLQQRLQTRDDIAKGLLCWKDPKQMVDDATAATKRKADTSKNALEKELVKFLMTVKADSRKRNNVVKNCGSVTLKETNCSALDVPMYGELAKPLLQGYILVTPDSPATRKLVARLEEPFKALDVLLRSIRSFANASQDMQYRAHESQLATDLRQFFEQAENDTTLQTVLPEGFKEWRRVMETIFAPPTSEDSPSALFNRLAELVPDETDCFMLDRFRFVRDEQELEETAVCLQAESQYLTGLVFNTSAKAARFEPYVSYKIRHVKTLVDGTNSWHNGRFNTAKRNAPLTDLKYLTFGFSFLQEAIDRALIYDMTGREPELGAYAQQKPEICSKKDRFSADHFLHVCVILSFIVPTALLVKNIVLEKEQKLKEQMRVMGLGDSVHFVSWALVSYGLNLITVISIALLTRGGRILLRTDVFILMLWLMLYSLCSVSMALFISTWFTNANKATGMCTVVIFLFMFPAVFAQSVQSKVFSMASLLLPQTAMMHSGWIIARSDGRQQINWRNLESIEHENCDIKLWECLAALAIDTVLYWCLAWYFSAIFPGTFGVGQPWYFPLTRSYWCPTGCHEEPTTESETVAEKSSERDPERFEDEPMELKTTVRMSAMAKEYDNGTIALSDLSLKLYESQITSLLGHNGAGKTTTMSMLCGVYAPSSGTATIYGRDLKTNMRRVRDVLGFCPQQNILFPMLTVHEQLRFFAALKGTPAADLHEAADDILEAMNMTEKRDSLASTLSGGQKRRLSIGIALIGGSKFVILDEPTAGVDVNNRKDIWKLLQENKKNRTILLSTHHMDEADVLSDRVAILSEGRLVSCGSPVFLKRKLGDHMQLTACKRDRGESYDEIVRRVETDSPLAGDIKCRDMNDGEIIFNIPVQTDSEQLEKFFVWFEDEVQSLKISDYGITAPSLQEIFIRLAPSTEYKLTKGKKWYQKCCRKQQDEDEVSSETKKEEDEVLPGLEVTKSADYDFDLPPPVSGLKRTFAHVRALLSAKRHYLIRNFRLIFFQILLPLLLVLSSELYATIMLPRLALKTDNPPPLPMFTSIFEAIPDSFISQLERQADFSRKLTASLLSKEVGMGPMCAREVPRWKILDKHYLECRKTTEGHWDLDHQRGEEQLPYCGCNPKEEIWNCTQEDVPLWNRQHLILRSTDRVWDMSGRDPNKLLMDTSLTTNTSEQTVYFQGGFSFLHRNPRAFTSEEVVWSRRGWSVLLDMVLRENATKADALPWSEFTDVLERLLDRLETKENVKIWFNNGFFAALPAYQSILTNAMLRAQVPEEQRSRYAILTVQHPMRASKIGVQDEAQVALLVFFRVILILLVICTVPAGFSTYLVEDRTTGSYHMQLVSGLSKKTYWLTSYLFDVFIYQLCAVALCLIYLAFGVKEFNHSPQTFFCFLLVFAVYGFSAVIWCYILQRWFMVSSVAFMLISVGAFFIGAVATKLSIILEVLSDSSEALETLYRICKMAFLVLPQYNVGMAVTKGVVSSAIAARGKQFLETVNRLDLADQLPVPSELQWDLMGMHVVVLGCHVGLAAVVFVILEHGAFSCSQRVEAGQAAKDLSAGEPLDDEDEDVASERRRVDGGKHDEQPLVVRDLVKRFNKTGLAVKGVTFAVDSNECFGLLGLNGAGKTTCFNILTGKIYASGGSVTINGNVVERGRTDAFMQVGYCPQVDALNEHLTTRENLVLYARLRAIPEGFISSLADYLLKALHLRPYANVLTVSLSGGNKRKLSVAIALISQPSLILLDEPSAGMDPGSQQFLWRVIEKLRKNGKAVVMTSHSMEECEALCTRIAIMDEGKVRCLGSKQHLKNKFGEGYSLTLKLSSSEDLEEQVGHAVGIVKKELPEATLEAAHCTTLFYKIQKGNVTIGSILKAVNRIKKEVRLEDYSLSQATLSDVFHRLGKRRRGGGGDRE